MNATSTEIGRSIAESVFRSSRALKTGIAAGLIALASAAPAHAVLVAAAPAVEGVRELPPVQNRLTEFPGGEFEATWDPATEVLNLSGDANILVAPGGSRTYTFDAVQTFQPIGLFPLQINPEVTADFKVVVSGGTTGAPRVTFFTFLSIFERGTFDSTTLERDNFQFDGAGALVAHEGTSVQQLGNGFKYGQPPQMDPFILVPGVDYVAALQVAIAVQGNDLDDQSPIAGVTFEAGGLSGFSGLSVDFNSQHGPEPTTAGLLLLGGAMILRRRR